MKILLIFILSMHICVLYSQNELLNEAKYWVWRDRLVNDFMVPNYTGDYAHKGRGIIFKTRGCGPFQDFDYNYWTSYAGGFDISDEGFELGKYLIVLASEWRLLYNSGLPTQQTEAEIFWALKTIDRLDYDAETYWSYFWSKGKECWGGQHNGFMIRDDVFTNFLWYSPIYPKPENNINPQYFYFFKNNYSLSSIFNIPPYLMFKPDAYENYRYLNQGLGGNRGKYIDQNIMLCNPEKDTIYDLIKLMWKARHNRNKKTGYPINGGFSAAMVGLYSCYDDKKSDYSVHINKYIPPDINFNFNRSKFRKDHWTGPEEYSQDNYIGLLQGLVAVRNFVNSDVYVNGISLSNYAKQRIKRIILSIRNNSSFNDNWVIDNPVTKLCVKGVHWSEYIDNCYIPTVCISHYCNKGGAQAGFFSGQFAKIYEKYVGENFNAQIIHGFISLPEKDLLPAILVTMSGSYFPNNVWGLESVNKKCCEWIDDLDGDNKAEFQYLDLLFCCLHGLTEPYRGFQHYYNILNSTICPNNERVGNLLSQMIIHNLLKILRGEKYQYTINDNNTYPSATTLCTQSQITFGNIESSATITQSPTSGCKANVTYKAGKEIHLKPGFKVINGAKFHGYIEPMNVCQVKEGNPDVAVLFFPPSYEQLSFYVSNLNYTKFELDDKNDNSNKQVINDNGIQLIPNPANDILVLQSNETEKYSVEIYDIMGQFIAKNNINPNENFSVGHLKRGLYIFKIFNQNELVQIQKIVLQ